VEHTGYLIAVEAGLLLCLLVAAGWTLYVRVPRRTRRTFKRAARVLGGRIDPASESARFPAILVDFDGLLVRAVLWPLDTDEEQQTLPPFLEICTPVDRIPTAVRVIRRIDEPRLRPMLRSRRAGSWMDADTEYEVTPPALRASSWAATALDTHPSWVLVELDRGRLRVLTNHPETHAFESKAIAQAILEFARALPEVATGAGLPQLARVHGPRHGPAIH
jgi:hypothetical protein